MVEEEVGKVGVGGWNAVFGLYDAGGGGGIGRDTGLKMVR